MDRQTDVSIRKLARETVLGYIFWTLFQALAPMIWFYPLNELEISGYEAFAVFLFSPILCGIPVLRRLFGSHVGLSVLRCMSVACVGSLQAPDTLSRLITLAIGCACVMLVLTVTLWSTSSYQRTLTCWGLVLGLMAFVSSRIWFTSFVPAWWNNTSNSVVIALGAIATLDKIFSGEDVHNEKNSDDSTKVRSEVEQEVQVGCWWCVGLGFGSLLYLTQAVFGDVSLVCRWTVAGFPDTGPMPYPYGALILVALALGVVLSCCRQFTVSVLWCLTGAASFAALYYLPTWQAFAGGVVLAVFTTSCWPVLLDGASLCPPVRTILLASLVWLVETLFSVWTVAYNFVPGGVYTREHTDWLITAVVSTLGLALYSCSGIKKESSPTAFISSGDLKMPNRNCFILLSFITLSGLAGFVPRCHKSEISHPPKVHPTADFSAAIWTYHFGYDNKGWQSLERSASLLRDTGADVITLLESDASKPFLGNHDLGMWLGEELGMYVDFGPSTRDHTWGNLILSKYPIIRSKHHLLPSPHGELAPAVTATINMTGHLVDFVVTHMGNDRDVLDRKQQAEVLSKELSEAKNPVVFLGYVTSAPGSRDYLRLLKHGKVKDIDSSDKDRWCEYIMYRGLIRLGYARISHGGLSDTEVQVGKFRIPENPDSYEDRGSIVTDADKITEDIRFSSRFGSFRMGHNWNPDHSYHMSTPKYFLP